MGEWTSLTATDGHSLAAYQADPQGPPAGALVIAQEVFGVNKHIRDVCDRFAEAGYRALVPALYDRLEPGVELGYEGADLQRARELRAALDWEQALLDIDAAVQSLARTHRVAVTGFCYGGTVAWLAASRLAIAGAVAYYGTFIHQFVDRHPQCPVLLHFGEQDETIPSQHIEDIRRRCSHSPVVIETYPGARHGFNCDLRASFDRRSASRAWDCTLAFLSRHLGHSPPGP